MFAFTLGAEEGSTTNPARGLSQWLEWDAPRALADGVLRFDSGSGAAARSGAYFIARETSLPPAVTVSNAAGLRAAVASATPGTRIQLRPGTYPGGFFFANVRGAEHRPIVIAAADPQQPPVIQGGGNGMQFSDPEFVELHDLVFTGATGNGLNLDDGGSFDTPARHLVLRGLLDDPPRSRPSLPTAETAGRYGQSPQFRDAAGGDLRVREDSPARGVGAEALPAPAPGVSPHL